MNKATAREFDPFIEHTPLSRWKARANLVKSQKPHLEQFRENVRQGKNVSSSPSKMPLSSSKKLFDKRSLIYDTSATHGGKKHWRPAHLPGYSFADRVKAYKKLKAEGGGRQTHSKGYFPYGRPGDMKNLTDPTWGSVGPFRTIPYKPARGPREPARDFTWGSYGDGKGPVTHKDSNWGTQSPGVKYVNEALRRGSDPGPLIGRGWAGDTPTAVWARRKTKELRDAGAPAFPTHLPPKQPSIAQRARTRLLAPAGTPKPLTKAEMQSTLQRPSMPAEELAFERMGHLPGEVGPTRFASPLQTNPSRYPPQRHARSGVNPLRRVGPVDKKLEKKLRRHYEMVEEAKKLRQRKTDAEISPQLNRYLAGEAHKKLVKRIRISMNRSAPWRGHYYNKIDNPKPRPTPKPHWSEEKGRINLVQELKAGGHYKELAAYLKAQEGG